MVSSRRRDADCDRAFDAFAIDVLSPSRPFALARSLRLTMSAPPVTFRDRLRWLGHRFAASSFATDFVPSAAAKVRAYAVAHATRSTDRRVAIVVAGPVGAVAVVERAAGSARFRRVRARRRADSIGRLRDQRLRGSQLRWPREAHARSAARDGRGRPDRSRSRCASVSG